MTEPKVKKAWYARPWAIAVWVVIAVFVLLSVVPLGGSDSKDGSAPLSLHAGSIKANNSLSTGSTTSGAGSSYFSARHVAVMVRTDHKVARGIGIALAKRLESIDFIEQVDLLMPGERLEPGQPLPNFFVMLEQPSFSASGLLVTGRKVKAEVNVNFGRDPVQSHLSSHDKFSAPLARVSLNCSLKHESESRGYETASVKYHQVIESVVEQIGGALEKHVRNWRGEYIEQGVIPEGLLPAYRLPPRDLPLPENGSIELVISGNELMTRNRSVWMMESSTPFEELAWVHAQLLEEGWRLDPKVLKRHDGFYSFEGSKGALLFEGFEVRNTSGIREEGETSMLIFRYLDRMDRDQVLPIFDAMIADPDLPAETGLCFLSCMDSKQRARLLETWMDRKVLPFEARVAIIRELERSGQKDEALVRLRSLHAVALLSSGNQTDEVKKLGRKITDDKKWEPVAPTEEELIAVGARSMGTNSTIDVEVGLNEPAAFIPPSKDDLEFALLSLVVKPSSIPEGLYTFAISYRTGSELSSSGSSSSTAHTQEHPWTGRISHGDDGYRFVANATETGTNRFSIVLEIQ